MMTRVLLLCTFCCSVLWGFILPYSTNSVIVKYQHTLAKSADLSAAFSTVNPDKVDAVRFGPHNLFAARLSFAEQQNIPALVEKLNHLDHVLYAQPNYYHPVSFTPDDPDFGHQWQLTTIQAEQAWDIVKGDGSVVVAIIDTGVDWQHPDLADGIWTNTREFLNDRDDDGNGFVDDIRGWDFVSRAADAAAGEDADDPDNDPMDFQGHGTFVSGCAAAISNNGVGVASPAYNAQIMPLRAGFKANDGHGYIMTFAAIEAMQYAVNQGADIINCSFGAAVDDQLLSDMALWALQSDVLVCWAAGNENSSHGVLPLSAPHVLTVASTDANDNKSVFSNYGRWVKISAPGSQVYSTGRNNNYYAGSGTSYASPIVAGAAALLRAQHPDWSAGQVFMHLVDHAESIDHIETRYVGKLGKKGRLNVYNAVSSPFTSQPHFEILRKTIFDPTGDADGFIDAGESVELSLRLENQWADAFDVTMTLQCDDPAVQIDNHSIQYDHIRGLELLGFNSVENSSSPFRFSVKNTFPHNIPFRLQVQSADGFSQTLDFQLAVNAQILFVDDDEGANAEYTFFQVMDSLGIAYDRWNRNVQGKTGTHLLRYPIVIWATEAGLPTLDSDDRDDLSKFLDNGGMLWISGQDLGWDLCGLQDSNVAHDYYNQFSLSNGRSLSFYEDYLHTQFLENRAAFSFLRGIDGNAVSEGIEFSIYNHMLSLDEQSPDAVQPLPPAESIFTYQDETAGATSYCGDSKVVNMGFGGLQAVAHEEDRFSITENVINYFTGIRLDVDPPSEFLADTLIFRARAVSEKTRDVFLYYSRNHQDFEKIAMTTQNDSDYTVLIHQPEIPNHLAYAVFAITQDSLYAPVHLYNEKISWQSPQIEMLSKHTSLTKQPEVMIKVDSEIGVDENNVFLHVAADNGDSVKMHPLNENVFSAFFPWPISFGDSLSIFYSATDVLGKYTKTHLIDYLVGIDDFSSRADWILGKNWQYNADEQKIYVCSSHENQNTTLQYAQPMDFSDMQKATFQAEISYDLRDQRAVYLEMSKDNNNWQVVGDYITGYSPDFYHAQWSLQEFTGAGCDSVYMRFRLKSGSADSACVFSVQEVKVLPYATNVEKSNSVVKNFVLYDNYPNPFNGGTTIKFSVPEKIAVRVEIFDILGKRVNVLVNDVRQAGEHEVFWDGTADVGSVASGIYFYKLSAGDYSAVQKLSIVR